jgi:hypothetical protein
MGNPISLMPVLLLFASTVKRILRLVALAVSSSYATIINTRPPGSSLFSVEWLFSSPEGERQ